jgi:aldehyde dehydrogenase (NAD+)
MNQNLFLKLKQKAQNFRFETYHERAPRLKKVLSWIQKNEELIVTALEKDFNKPKFETQISEVKPTVDEIKYILKNLKCWMRDKKVSTPLTLVGHTSRIRYENKGVVLVIASWNYPFQLAIAPMVAALSAGNSVVIKPSELTPHTSDLIKKLVEECFESNEVTVELGDKDKTTELLTYNFDHVFFTGSTQVGRIIAQKCAERLIPLTLELGGKSPTIIDETADLDEASEKIFWGKFLNRAQTCIAPDYLIVHHSVVTELINKIKTLANRNDTSQKARIINEKHHTRLQQLCNTTTDLNQKTLEVIEIENNSHPLMQEEIFGPALPVFKYSNLEELSSIIGLEKPLSLYVFSKNQKTIDYILNTFSSGGVGINSVLLHFANHHLPFGGIGQSGYGKYHGHFGFLELSHQRAVVERKFFAFTRKLLLPPYSQEKYKLLKFF